MAIQPPQQERLGRIDVRILDLAGALLLAGIVLQAAASRQPGGLRPLEALASVLAVTTVAWRRRVPPAAMIVAGAAILWLAYLQHGRANAALTVEPIALALDCYVLGRSSVARYGRWVFGSCLAAGLIVLAAGGSTTPDPAAATTFSSWLILVVLPFTVGRTLARRRGLIRQLEETAAELEHEQETSAGRAAELERNRVARELHDVIAHNLSVMVIQTTAARRVTTYDRPSAEAALEAVEGSGREALVELRRIMGVVRRDDDGLQGTGPGLSQLEGLVARTRAAGIAVDLATEGTPVALGPGLDLVAYRVVQESLTNTLKHAGPTQARVLVGFSPGLLTLDVSDRGPASAGGAGKASGSGQGLLGMRERVGLFGGELSAGPTPDGGFRVHARLPLTGASR